MDLDFLNYRKQGNFNNVLIGFIIHQSMKFLTFGFSDNLHFHWLFNKSTKYETAFVCVVFRIQGSEAVCQCLAWSYKKIVKNCHVFYCWLCHLLWETVLLCFSVALVLKQNKVTISYVHACCSVILADLQGNPSPPELGYCLYLPSSLFFC